MDRTHETSSQEDPESSPLNTYANIFQIPTIEFTTEPEEIEYQIDGADPARREPASFGVTGVTSPQRGAKDTTLVPTKHDAKQNPNLTVFVFGNQVRQQPDVDVVTETDEADAPVVYGRHSQGWISGIIESPRS